MPTRCSSLFPAAAVALLAVSLAAQESVDRLTIEKIRREGLEHPRVLPTFNHLVTVIGPRFTATGLPGCNPIQDYVNYDVRTHHTNMDTFDRVREED